MRRSRGNSKFAGILLFCAGLVVLACSDAPVVYQPEVPRPFSEQGDSAVGPPSVARLSSNGGIVLTQRSTLTVTLKERNAAWWHDLSVVAPETLHLVGPGYLFPGPSYSAGPYDPGPVTFKLDAYNPRPPHQYFSTALYQVTGSEPTWLVRFEDGADGDFDDIVIEVTATPESSPVLQVDCTPSPVVRGSDVSCTAAAPGSSSLVVTDWQFQGSGNYSALTASESSAANPWLGPLVADGVVTVTADVDGAPQTANTTVSVQARSWGSVTASFTITEDSPGPLKDPPAKLGELGQVGHAPRMDVAQITQVPTGPNQDLHYLTGIPYGVEAIINVNTDALKVQSIFWGLQPNQQYVDANNVVRCARSDVVPFIPIVRRHEGLTLATGSHTRFYKDKLDQLAGPAFEALVGAQPFDVLTAGNPIFSNIQAQAQAESARADNAQNRPTYCLFHF